MVDCTPPASRFSTIFVNIDNLGWDCFLDGRIPYSLIVSITPMFLQYNPRGLVKNWSAKLIQSLLSWMHKQWLYWNSNVHYVSEGLTTGQHDELQEKIYGLMRTKRSAPLPLHQHFLTIDFITLGCGSTLACQVWVANMEMAISVSKVARDNFCTQESLCLLCTLLEAPISKPPPSSQTRIASSTNIFPHIKLHSTLFAASSHSRTIWLPRTAYNKHCNHNHPSSCSHHLSLSPNSLQHKWTTMSKTPHQLFPLFYPAVAPQPYHKNMAHLNRLHVQKKTVATTGSSLVW